jgi:hypothetical protein
MVNKCKNKMIITTLPSYSTLTFLLQEILKRQELEMIAMQQDIGGPLAASRASLAAAPSSSSSSSEHQHQHHQHGQQQYTPQQVEQQRQQLAADAASILRPKTPTSPQKVIPLGSTGSTQPSKAKESSSCVIG